MSYIHRVSHVVGDLIESPESVIAQGCNLDGVIGGGVSGPIVQRYPRVEIFYREACTNGTFRLGSVQAIPVNHDGRPRYVLNLGTQRRPGRDGSYWAIMLAFGNAFEWARAHAVDRIGCGIAGLDWDTVEFILRGIYEYVPDGPEIVVYTHPSEVHKWVK